MTNPSTTEKKQFFISTKFFIYLALFISYTSVLIWKLQQMLQFSTTYLSILDIKSWVALHLVMSQGLQMYGASNVKTDVNL